METGKEFVMGRCMNMCPANEVIVEKERLLHILEVVPGTERNVKPKADSNRVVKSFCRSAAGKYMQDPKNLRPPDVLLKTVDYLLGEVISNKKVPWSITYDFIMDRLRSVRQDMIIQNVPLAQSICILQPIVRFYAYASYRLCEQSVNSFDPHINKTHLQECLKRLLCLYNECDYLYIKKELPKETYFIQELSRLRPEFEALYLILNLGNTEALTRILNLHKMWRNKLVNLAFSLSLNYFEKNFVKVCRLMRELPVLLLAVASLHLPEIRRQSLQIMSVAYNSKNLWFPTSVLMELFLYNNVAEVTEDCQYYGIDCKDQGVQFIRNMFDNTKIAVQPKHLLLVDKMLAVTNIRSLILK